MTLAPDQVRDKGTARSQAKLAGRKEKEKGKMYNPNARYESVNAEIYDVEYVTHVQHTPPDVLVSLALRNNEEWEDPEVVAVDLIDLRLTEADAKHLLELLQLTLGERRL